jgi:hypothetical protein
LITQSIRPTRAAQMGTARSANRQAVLLMEESGAEIARSVGKVKDALHAIACEQFDPALLDANLCRETVDEIAE